MRIAFAADDENDTTRAVLDALAGHEILRPAAPADWPDLGRFAGADWPSSTAEPTTAW